MTLQNLDSIVADFWVPQETLSKLMVGHKVGVVVDTFPGETFTGKSDRHRPPRQHGQPQRPGTGAIGQHRPQAVARRMFARVSVQSGEAGKFVTLPQTALAYNSYGATVFVVRDKGEAGKPKLVSRPDFCDGGPDARRPGGGSERRE